MQKVLMASFETCQKLVSGEPAHFEALHHD